jgi:hypothetical protein
MKSLQETIPAGTGLRVWIALRKQRGAWDRPEQCGGAQEATADQSGACAAQDPARRGEWMWGSGNVPATSAQGAEDERQATGWPGQPRIPADTDSDRGLYERCARDVKPATRSPSKPITETGAVAAGELSSDGQDVGAAPE